MSLVVLDDVFPNGLSGFRLAEYNHYLSCFGSATIACSSPNFIHDFDAYSSLYGRDTRVIPLETLDFGRPTLAYMNFLNNAAVFLDFVERAGWPFLFTLYPGGGLDPHTQDAQEKLRRVLDSPNLRAVITTQPVVSQLLIERSCRAPVYEVYGAAIGPQYFEPLLVDRRAAADGPLRICFAAYNYANEGASKGYHEVLTAARHLVERGTRFELTVIGNYDPDFWLVTDGVRARTRFIGLLGNTQLRGVLLEQDVIVSPTRVNSFTGQFDGFPTAACVEASLCGVVVVTSDELRLNRAYGPDEMIIVEPRASAIADVLVDLARDRGRLSRIAEAGRRRTRALFSPHAQLRARTDIIRRAAAREGLSL